MNIRLLTVGGVVAGLLVAATATAVFAAHDGDDLRDATKIAQLPYAADGVDTSSATKQDGETVPRCIAPFGADISLSVWYRFEVKERGQYLLDTHGSSYDTVLTVYAPSRRNAKVFDDLAATVECNDDNFGGVRTTQARVIATLEPGTYYAQIGDYREPDPGAHLLNFHIDRYTGQPLP